VSGSILVVTSPTPEGHDNVIFITPPGPNRNMSGAQFVGVRPTPIGAQARRSAQFFSIALETTAALRVAFALTGVFVIFSKEKSMRTLALIFGVLLSTLAAQAAPNDVFLMQIPGITGESTHSQYPGWIFVNAFSAGITTPISGATGGGGAGAGRTTCHPLVVIKPLDSTSPELALDAATGLRLATVVLVALNGNGGNHEFLRFTLKNAFITSVEFGGDSVSSSRTETITIAAEQIQISATSQSTDGTAGHPVTTQINCAAIA
jgi:type VI secretion system secreted protein Hcp